MLWFNLCCPSLINEPRSHCTYRKWWQLPLRNLTTVQYRIGFIKDLITIVERWYLGNTTRSLPFALLRVRRIRVNELVVSSFNYGNKYNNNDVPSNLVSSNSKNSDGMSPRGINTQLLGSQFFLFISRETTVGFRKNCVAVVFTSLLFLSFHRIELSLSCSIPYLSKAWMKSFSTRATPLMLLSSTE